jgi:hypothetical protein
MRFTLYGEAEGVLGRSEERYWATVARNVVTDASVSARNKGIQPGTPVHVAKALLPSLVIEDEPDLPPPLMQSIWLTLWNASPWLEAVGKQAFYLQIPGKHPPLREVRSLLSAVEAKLSDEQRIRVSLAENPFLARALWVWSRIERVPDAVYYKVGKVQWLVSPGLARWGRRGPSADLADWIRKMPVAALWVLPDATRTALQKLGVSRMHELEQIPGERLIRHFGKEALLWLGFLKQSPGGSVHVNYPPVRKQSVWRAALGEEVGLSALPEIVERLVLPLSTELQKTGFGALKVGLAWETDAAGGAFEKVAKKPVYTAEALQAALASGIQECRGSRLQMLEVYAEDLRPLQSVQTSFVLKNGAFVPAEEQQEKDLGRLLKQVNRKFPKGLQVGLRPTFRELRLQAVLEQARQNG